MRPLASYLDRARAFLTPPRSTARSKPTLSRSTFTTLRKAFAINQPISRMIRKMTTFGAHNMMLRTTSFHAPRMSIRFHFLPAHARAHTPTAAADRLDLPVRLPPHRPQETVFSHISLKPSISDRTAPEI